jgi:DHA3 family macrolide efflux protein-like MFS transporter
MPKLWNRNFAILTIGSFVSALGSAASSIAFGYLIYMETGSPLYLALYTVANIIPRMLTSFLAGPFVDRHSRTKIIYTLDFISTVCFATLAIVLYSGFFNVLAFTLLAAFFGCIDSVYQIAFMSLYPEAIPPGQHQKAYSLSSLLWPVASAIMAPIAAKMIGTFDHGAALLIGINACTYFTAAILETTMKFKEKLNDRPVVGFQFIEDFREGFKYYRTERGILGIGILFALFSFGYAARDLLMMPYFLSGGVLTLEDFGTVMAANSIGRIIGGLVHYNFSYPPKKRFTIAVCVYFIVELIAATYLFFPFFLIVSFSVLDGLLSVTSYTIRVAATQAYLPAPMRGRINATQNLLSNIGYILGSLAIGIIATFVQVDFRIIILCLSVVPFSAILLFPLRMHKDFKKIYNAVI